MRGILVIHPFKTGGHEVELMQRRRGPVEPVQVAHQPLYTRMSWIVQQMPVQALVMVPFARLGKFAAHEQQLLAGVAEHEAQVGTQIGELLPRIAGHLAQQ